jgi:hypothetical protein
LHQLVLPLLKNQHPIKSLCQIVFHGAHRISIVPPTITLTTLLSVEHTSVLNNR